MSCRALADADVRADLAEIGIPTLLICGTKDPVTTVHDGEFIQSKIQGSEFQSIEASHLSNIECPVAFSQILAKFIA